MCATIGLLDQPHQPMTASLEEICNFLQVRNPAHQGNCIATAGQPTEKQFSLIKESGYQVVINLAPSTSTNAIANEAAIVESLGMHYIHIPIVWDSPALEDVERFFDAMNANANRFVFIHCAKNMRVSAFVYLYQRICKRVSNRDAKADLQKIWIPDEIWQTFIQSVLAHYHC